MKKFYVALGLAVFLAVFAVGTAEARTRSLPKKITRHKFGFLTGDVSEGKIARRYHAGWVRPHVGPFLWDAMQESSGADVDFYQTDRIMKKFSARGLGVLATLWPFAEWDQERRDNAEDCKVSANDQFLPGDKGGDYLTRRRCNPYDWLTYQSWVRSVVERYDGDGVDDMPGLKYPIKYWEVMNEPDLEGSDTLDFYVGNASDYQDLLEKTYAAVKAADSDANVLIAAAANTEEQNLDFYRSVFASADARESFDIANVHCISSGDVGSLNVSPYKNMLSEFSLDSKSIWVTEAEAMTSSSKRTNARQLQASAKEARRVGASRIFFTRFSFNPAKDYGDWDVYSKKFYKRMFRKKWAL